MVFLANIKSIFEFFTQPKFSLSSEPPEPSLGYGGANQESKFDFLATRQCPIVGEN